MLWQDEGILIQTRRHGESHLIATLLTHHHGLHNGLFRQGRGSARLQSGVCVQARWSARLPEHLGTWTLESHFSPFAHIYADRLKMKVLTVGCQYILTLLPEREPCPNIYLSFQEFLESLVEKPWEKALALLELNLLKFLGFPLKLDKCTVTGSQDDLAYISPRSGAAVSHSAGKEYAEKLIPYPKGLHREKDIMQLMPDEIRELLQITAYFLERYIFSSHDLKLPDLRFTLVS